MHISSRKFGVLVVCFAALMLASAAMAQNRIIKGTVTDDKGQPVAGVSILIQKIDSKVQYNTKTDKKGNYIYMGLPGGDFHVVARAQGFAPAMRTPVTASIQNDAIVNLKLEPGADHKLFFEMTPEEYKKLEQEVKAAEKIKESSGEVKGFIDAGNKFALEGKDAEAIEEFKKALEKNPDRPDVMAYMAESYRKLDKNNEALEFYQKAIALSPNDAVLYTNMGVVLDKLGKTAESQEAFKKSASVNPGGSAQSYFNLGATLVNSGKTTEAIDSFKQAIAVDANHAEAHYELGLLLAGKAETMPESIRLMQRYVQIGQKPDHVEVAKQMITALEQMLKKK
jgi:tetratricopeptide (TPR) repeat protein